MNNSVLTKKLFLLKILTNNIEGKITENFEEIGNEIKQKIEKAKNTKIYQKTKIAKNLQNYLWKTKIQKTYY